jgi:hypothetical protein
LKLLDRWPQTHVAYRRQKLSRAAKSVNRECGTEYVIGGGSGELLGDW